MTTFLILAAGLAALALLFILIPLLAPPPAAGIAPEQLNLALFRQQLAELDADLANGKLDQTRYEAARADLERAALHDLAPPSPAAAPGTHPAPAADDRQVRWVVRGIPLSPARLTNWGLGLGVPLLALGLYLGLGDAGMIGRMATAPQLAAVTGHGEGGSELPPLDVLVARLEQRMTEAPDDAQGWVMLGRTYFALRDAANAERALGRAYALTPRDPEVILAYAESIAANHDNDLTGRPAELVSEVLAMDREHVTARWLAGMAAFQRGQYQSAARAWQQVLAQIDPASEDAGELRALIAEAQTRAGIPVSLAAAPATAADVNAAAAPPAAVAAGGPEAPAAADEAEAPAAADQAGNGQAANDQASNDQAGGGPTIEVSVSLAPALAADLPPQATVFVYAKAAAGPPMPLAVQRATVADLPLTVQLDDSMAMLPTLRLSAFPEVIVGARISRSGQATPQPGDLEGETAPLTTADSPQVTVLIDQVRGDD